MMQDGEDNTSIAQARQRQSAGVKGETRLIQILPRGENSSAVKAYGFTPVTIPHDPKVRSTRNGAAPFLNTGTAERGHQTPRAGRYVAGIGGQLRLQHIHHAPRHTRRMTSRKLRSCACQLSPI
jgi:hypothetical protein